MENMGKQKDLKRNKIVNPLCAGREIKWKTETGEIKDKQKNMRALFQAHGPRGD